MDTVNAGVRPESWPAILLLLGCSIILTYQRYDDSPLFRDHLVRVDVYAHDIFFFACVMCIECPESLLRRVAYFHSTCSDMPGFSLRSDLRNVLAGSLIDIVRHAHVQLWWLFGAFCVIGVVIVCGITKNRQRDHK